MAFLVENRDTRTPVSTQTNWYNSVLQNHTETLSTPGKNALSAWLCIKTIQNTHSKNLTVTINQTNQ